MRLYYPVWPFVEREKNEKKLTELELRRHLKLFTLKIFILFGIVTSMYQLTKFISFGWGV